MRAIIQRVSSASVKVSHEKVGDIQNGLLIYLGVGPEDDINDIQYLSKKITQMRIFHDENEKMNLSLLDVNGECLVISQFTLFASTKKGNRPSFTNAAPPELANQLYEEFVKEIKQIGVSKVETGSFGAHMMVEAINNGPVNIIIDSKNKEL
jgi:D-tyrosyl-tRNA(Tyr) deacylase